MLAGTECIHVHMLIMRWIRWLGKVNYYSVCVLAICFPGLVGMVGMVFGSYVEEDCVLCFIIIGCLLGW